MAIPVPQGTPTVRWSPTGTTYIGDSPTGVSAGELLVAHVRCNLISTTLTDLLGFTQEGSTTGTGLGTVWLLWKIADATDEANAGVAGAYSFAADNSTTSGVALFRVSGIDTTTPVDVSNIEAEASAASWTTSGITTTGADRLLVWFASSNINNTYTFSAGSDLYDQSTGTNRSLAAAQEDMAAAGATGTRTITPSATNAGITGVMAIAPAAAGPPDPGPDADRIMVPRRVGLRI